MKQLNLEDFNDYELIYLAKEHNNTAYEILQQKYEPIVISVAKRMQRAYPNLGLDLQDYILEGRFAIANAIDYFNEQYDNLFYTYVIKCIRLTILTLVRRNKRDSCLNNALEWTDELKVEKIKNLSSNIQIKEVMAKTLKHLNALEKKILFLKIKGYSYTQIADKLLISKKKVDNTLLKIRNIIQKFRKE